MEAGGVVGWIVGAGGAGKMIWDIVRARGEARRMDASAAKTLVATANASANEWQQDVAEMKGELREVRAEQRKLEADQRAQDRRITAHLRWDNQVAEKLRALGEQIGDPPPLYAEET